MQAISEGLSGTLRHLSHAQRGDTPQAQHAGSACGCVAFSWEGREGWTRQASSRAPHAKMTACASQSAAPEGALFMRGLSCGSLPAAGLFRTCKACTPAGTFEALLGPCKARTSEALLGTCKARISEALLGTCKARTSEALLGTGKARTLAGGPQGGLLPS